MNAVNRKESRTRSLAPFIATILAIMLSCAGQLATARADSSSSSMGTSTFTPTGPIVIMYAGPTPVAFVTYVNNAPYPANGTVFADVQDYLGRSVYAANFTAPTTGPGQDFVATFLLPVPFGEYTLYTFVVSHGGMFVSPANSTTLIG
jgi:hypothetical protein